ncbi:UvrD-helicase domain-containing protein [Methanobrevibacter arboriphilus]|uniref:UvrD-helicase domain-containing protein n=1 Tax=Methanobrevibacter arboriphilus TaxID=39441 RepID=UPI000AF0AC28|nr:UvrD-helicase domain-containing protein [Methanobrevibacter arboriphilus]
MHIKLTWFFSEESRVIVEAPAGYGKTKTLISKIAYLICDKYIKNSKKILILTFSVNAAYKIKKDILINLPIILEEYISSKDQLSNHIFFYKLSWVL